MTKTLLASTALFLLLASPTQAHKIPCATYETTVDRLATDFHESPKQFIQTPTIRYEYWAASGAETWTLLVVSEDGVNACLLGAGKAPGEAM